MTNVYCLKKERFLSEKELGFRQFVDEQILDAEIIQRFSLRKWCQAFRQKYETQILLIIVAASIMLGWCLNSIF